MPKEPAVLDTSKVTFFKFDNRAVASSSRFTRRLVLFRISTELQEDGPVMLPPASAAALVLGWWRQKVQELADESSANTAVDFVRMMAMKNCTPSTVRSSPPATFQCACAYCPWCYGRRMESLTRALEYDSEGDVFAPWNRGVWFWSTRREIAIPADAADKVLTGALAGEASALRGIVRTNRDKVVGSSWQVMVEPVGSDGDANAAFKVTSAMLLLGKESAKLTGFLYQAVVGEGSATAENRDLGMKYVFAYPVGFVHGDPELCRRIIIARRGLRLCESTGSFRGTVEDKDE